MSQHSPSTSRRGLRIAVLAALTLLTGWVVFSWASGGVMALVLSTSLGADEKLVLLRAFFASWGRWAPAIYVGLVLVEAVIAPIPGAILYLPGGVIFGGFWGGTLSLIGNVLAAGVCAALIRTVFGKRLFQGALGNSRVPGLEEFILRHGVISIALLRVNPLTSSDLVSYAAGLSPLSIRTVMLGTLVGMAPLCYLQAYLSRELFETFPWLLWPFLILCGAYAAFVAWALVRMPGR